MSNMDIQFYILENGKPVPVSTEEWGAWLQNEENRVIDATEVITNVGRWIVSTVFTGFDQGGPGHKGPALLFETAIVSMDGDEPTEIRLRSATMGEAKQFHYQEVQRLRELVRGS